MGRVPCIPSPVSVIEITDAFTHKTPVQEPAQGSLTAHEASGDRAPVPRLLTGYQALEIACIAARSLVLVAAPASRSSGARTIARIAPTTAELGRPRWDRRLEPEGSVRRGPMEPPDVPTAVKAVAARKAPGANRPPSGEGGAESDTDGKLDQDRTLGRRE